MPLFKFKYEIKNFQWHKGHHILAQGRQGFARRVHRGYTRDSKWIPICNVNPPRIFELGHFDFEINISKKGKSESKFVNKN